MFKDKESSGKPISKLSQRGKSYDERSGFFVGAGDDYGTGHRVPVGKDGNARATGVIPKNFECKELSK